MRVTHTHTYALATQGYGNKKFVFQGVHETICYGPAEHAWEEGEEPVNQIVFIGKGLDRKVRFFCSLCVSVFAQACVLIYVLAHCSLLRPAHKQASKLLDGLEAHLEYKLLHTYAQALVQGFRTCVWSPLPEGWCQTVDAATGQVCCASFLIIVSISLAFFLKQPHERRADCPQN